MAADPVAIDADPAAIAPPPRRVSGAAAAAIAALLLVLSLATARGAGLTGAELFIPGTFPGLFGASVDRLEALMFRPDDGERHPLAILTHGSAASRADQPRMSPFLYWAQAVEFARRGWTAVVVMRRGFGKSEGSSADLNMSCPHRYVEEGVAAAASLGQAIVYLARQPYVDPARIIVVGHSNGGFATVALTAAPPPGVVAAISFAGGRGSYGSNGRACDEPQLIDAFRTFGTTSRVPMLWVYAANDRWFGPALAAQFAAAFTAAGGRAQFVAAPAFGQDGHRLYSFNGRAIWLPLVDAFLAAQGLTPRAAPLEMSPLPSAAPARLTPFGRFAFATFLMMPGHKAFAVAATGYFGWAFGRGAAADARGDALRRCARAGAPGCMIVSAN
jgi:dienelactone hydrolase